VPGEAVTHAPAGERPVLVVDDLVVEYPVGRKEKVHAVSGVSFDLFDGETLGLVGESGCGKSSLGRAVMQLPPPTHGSVRLDDVELTSLTTEALRRTRPRMQMIFQDPRSSLNPRRKVKDLVAEGLAIWRHDRGTLRSRVEETLRAVNLNPGMVWDRRPQELSGGQCQRVCIARALTLAPRVLICDEPVSQLDVSVQAQILNLLEETKERYELNMLFIAHDLAVVKNISDRIMVMYLGKVCEVAPANELYREAAHPYTKLLLESVPQPGRERTAVRKQVFAGELASPLDPPSGCRFRTRCPLATDRCSVEEPALREMASGHRVACHYAEQAQAM